MWEVVKFVVLAAGELPAVCTEKNNQMKKGTGVITRVSKKYDAPWWQTIQIITCPDGLSLMVQEAYLTEAEIPKVGDEVDMVFRNNFWQLQNQNQQ